MALSGNALPLLAPQSFAQGTLVRNIPSQRDQDFLAQALPAAEFLLVMDRSMWVHGGTTKSARPGNETNGDATNGSSSPPERLLWCDAPQLQQLLGLKVQGNGFRCSTGDNDWEPEAYLLGVEVPGERPRFVLPLPAARLPSLEAPIEREGWRREDLRTLMSVLPAEDLAVAGHAVALASWHQINAFCARCGARTEPIEGGAKRRCKAEARHRVYPRTDPVAIMMVESPDGSHALLGRSRGHRPGMLTCLSGFVDQAESIEEAVRREVKEEAGIEVGPVAIIGSQPWPIGRGGSCELMIGCIAAAVGDAPLSVDFSEMEDVRWVPRDTVLQAVEASAKGDHLASYNGEDRQEPAAGFWLPPSYAIAHNLIREWATRPHSWFAAGGGGSRM